MVSEEVRRKEHWEVKANLRQGIRITSFISMDASKRMSITPTGLELTV